MAGTSSANTRFALLPGHDGLGVGLRNRFLGLFRPLAVVGVEKLLAQPDRLRGDLDQFVVLDIGQRLFQGHLDRRGQGAPVVLSVRPRSSSLNMASPAASPWSLEINTPLRRPWMSPL